MAQRRLRGVPVDMSRSRVRSPSRIDRPGRPEASSDAVDLCGGDNTTDDRRYGNGLMRYLGSLITGASIIFKSHRHFNANCPYYKL